MELGTSFLNSKLARRFCLLFILCAFTPTITLVVLSYNKVANQLEEQSLIRLKREVKSYSLSLFDRMIRIDNDLQIIGRSLAQDQNDFSAIQKQYSDSFETLYEGLVIYTIQEKIIPVFGTLDHALLGKLLSLDQISADKPFILSSYLKNSSSQFFFCAIINKTDYEPFIVLAEVRSEYLWGVGHEPILPPMTELSVYDSSGKNIMASQNAPSSNFHSLPKVYTSDDLRVFQYELDGRQFLASTSNLFIESRFQKTGWTIILSTAKDDIMSAMQSFKRTFPFITLLFLLLIFYLSIVFIRKGLAPLELLKQGTQRIARKDFTSSVDIQSGDEFEELGQSFNTMASQLDKQFNALTVLGEIDRAILSSLDRKKILATTLMRLKTFFQCDISILVKFSDSLEEQIKIYIMEGRRREDPRIEYSSITEPDRLKLLTDFDHFILDSTDETPPFLQDIDASRGLSYLCLPLKVDNCIKRVLLLGRSDNHVYNEDELSQARQIANQLAVALANSLLLEDIEKLAMGTIEALARTVDAKSKWTAGHSERVADLSGKIGKVMGLSEREIESLIRGGLLHDIGKIGIPITILDKPGKLTDDEFVEIKNHPAIGGQILEPIKAYQDIMPLIVQHHEKVDGTGYPGGLKGDEIDIRARILSVADVWDALVSERPYRAGWVNERAKKLIIKGSGSHFDQNVVNAFLAVIAEG